jgi:hypothetical protein
MRIFVGNAARRVQALPASGAGFEGMVAVGKADGSGVTFATAAGVSVIDCGGLPLVGNELGYVTITATTGVTGRLHRGRVLHYAGTGPINLNFNLDATDNAGVSDGFHCVILRSYDAGSSGNVTVTLGSGLTLQRGDNAVRCGAGFPVGVAVIGTRFYLTGGVIP